VGGQELKEELGGSREKKKKNYGHRGGGMRSVRFNKSLRKKKKKGRRKRVDIATFLRTNAQADETYLRDLKKKA